jgi:hypothetical protein
MKTLTVASVILMFAGFTANAEVIYVNQADAGPHHLQARDATTGAVILDFSLPGNGRGVVKVGNILYVTTANSNNVDEYDATTGIFIATAFSVAGATGLSTLAYDGTNFYIGDYSGTNNVYYYTTTGTLLRTIPLSLCADHCDGLEYFNLGSGGRLISNRGDAAAGGVYDVYDTNGTLLTTALITTGDFSTGIAFDGTNFYVSNIFTRTLGVYNTSGVLQRTVDVSAVNAGLIEDMSFDYTVVLAAPGNNDTFQVRYAANLNIGDSFVDFTNSGATVANNVSQNLCINLYTFDPAEELISCCTCSVTPNGLQSLSVLKSLISNPLTPAVPTAVVIKAVASTGVCNASSVNSANLAHGLLAWGTTLHRNSSSAAASYSVVETPFTGAVLSDSELAHITSTCGFIQSNGSSFGICKGCAAGGLGAGTSNQ